MHFSLMGTTNRNLAFALFLLFFLTISSCSTPGGALNFMEDRRGYACNVVKVFYDYDYDKISKLLNDNQDPDIFESNTIYNLRGEMKFMYERLIKNSEFHCFADYESQEMIVAHGSIRQQWDHGTGLIEFHWDFHFALTGEALLQKFEINESVVDYMPLKVKDPLS